MSPEHQPPVSTEIAGTLRGGFWRLPIKEAFFQHLKRAFNKAMSSAWITVECAVKEGELYFTAMDFKRKLRLGQSPVGLLYLCVILLSTLETVPVQCIFTNSFTVLLLLESITSTINNKTRPYKTTDSCSLEAPKWRGQSQPPSEAIPEWSGLEGCPPRALYQQNILCKHNKDATFI